MLLPHTVTVYNSYETTDMTTFEEVRVNNMTVLSGVLLDATKGANVRQSGLVDADAVTLHIPLGIVGVDAVTGEEKEYIEPILFWALDNSEKPHYWTLSVGQETFFAKGAVVEADKDFEYISTKYPDVYLVTKVDRKDFGGLAHFECGGR